MQDVPKIVVERLKAAAPVVEHPDSDVLTAFAEQALPAPERTSVLRHLARCSDCREIIALALPATEPTATTTIPARTGWLTWPALRWGLVAAGIVIIASLGVLQYRRNSAPSIARYSVPKIAVPEPRAQTSPPAGASPASPTPASSDKSATASSYDSLSTTNAVIAEPSEPKSEPKSRLKSPTRAAVASATTPGGSLHGSIGGPVNRNQLPHGPKMPAQQWQQNNNGLQLQSSNNFALAAAPDRQTAGAASAAPAPAISQTTAVEASGAASQLDTLAQNQEIQLPPKADSDNLIKAKPAEPASVTLLAAGPGQIGGYVLDPSGAAVPNARITITPTASGSTTTAVTNSQGAWLIVGLPTGTYKAQAEAPGFSTTVADLNYDASRPSTYRFTLNVGSVSETVAVSAQNAQTSSYTSSAGATIAAREVSPVPLNGRNVTGLTSLSNNPRWTITSSGALQRSFDQGRTWQSVDVSASSAANLQLAANQPTSSQSVSVQSMAKQKTVNQKDAKKEVSAPAGFRAVAASGAEVWAGGSGGALYHSRDAGNNWVRIQPSANGSVLTGDIISLDFPDSQHGKVTTSTPEVWVTSDAGQSWQKQ